MRSTGKQRRPRVLAIASGGGHWVQLLRLRPAFEHCDVTYVTVHRNYATDVPAQRFRAVPDATRWSKFRLLFQAFSVAWRMCCCRPDVIVTTGAAPGYFAVILGKWFGARSVWIDSIANVEQLSLSGQRAGGHVDLWLTQWEHLAAPGGPAYAGAVL